jgi:acylpyruvate hydrolase
VSATIRGAATVPATDAGRGIREGHVRLATVRSGDGTGTWAATVDGDELVEVAAPDVGTLLAAAGGALDPAAIPRPDSPRREAVAGASLAAVVPQPRKVICVGLNYRHHILEMGRELPSHPTLFAKYALALTGPRDDIPIPPESPQVDWEAELAIVIGRPARRVAPADALDHVAGYAVLNDVSMRDWQYRTLQWLQGKTWERSTPLGPWLVTPDEVDHAADLRLSCEVNGQMVQEARTSDLLFRPADVVAYISTFVTLEPGDVIATGTPGGVGHARDPQVFLRAGDTVRTAIEGIGELVNACVAG